MCDLIQQLSVLQIDESTDDALCKLLKNILSGRVVHPGNDGERFLIEKLYNDKYDKQALDILDNSTTKIKLYMRAEPSVVFASAQMFEQMCAENFKRTFDQSVEYQLYLSPVSSLVALQDYFVKGFTNSQQKALL